MTFLKKKVSNDMKQASIKTNTIFEDSVSRINMFYRSSDNDLGWRFLTCSKTVLSANPHIALITLNPAGRTIPDDHPFESCENGSAYIYESWAGCEPGESPLQNQIKKLFSLMNVHLGQSISNHDLLESSITAHFIPFRSPRISDLKNKKEVINFSTSLWSDILNTVSPKYFICIDRETFKLLKKLISRTYNLPIVLEKKMETGWGNYSADIVSFGEKSQKKLLRLPHLSTFKLFSREACSLPMNKIMEEFIN